MDNDVSQKFCETCGKTNEIAAKFCKFCGGKFPMIDHPAFQESQQLNMGVQTQYPTKPIYPILNQPQNPDVSTFQQYPSTNPNANYGMPVINPPRAWRGGGLFDAIIKIYKNPIKYSAEILEDPKSPPSVILIIIYGIVLSVLTYFEFLNVDFVNVDVSPDYQHYFTTYDGRRDYAILSAGLTFVAVFVLWLLMSWMLGAMIRGGLHYSHFVRYNSTSAMRKFVSYLTVPFTIKNLCLIVLLQFEPSRQIEVSSSGTYNFPTLKTITNYSETYLTVNLVLGLIASIIGSILLYRSLKFGLGHHGKMPGLLAGLFIFINLTL